MFTEYENTAWNTIEELKDRVLSGFATHKELLMYTDYTDTLGEVKDKIKAAIIVCKGFGKIKDDPWEKLTPELTKETQQFKAKYEKLKNNITGTTNIELEFKLV